jgi:membrane-bound serine protease (ClpP class)
MLIRTDQAWNIRGISLVVIIPAVIVTAAFFLVVAAIGIKAQRLVTATGMEGMIGQTGESITPLNPVGKVLVHGEIWNAQSTNGEFIAEGKKVRVTSLNNLTVAVETL